MEHQCFISEYLNKDWGAIDCVLKKFYSDFIVQELDKNGSQLKLLAMEDVQKHFEDFERSTSIDCSAEESSEAPAIPEAVTESIREDLTRISASEDKKSAEKVVIPTAGLDKAARKSIHDYVRKTFSGILDTKTEGDNIVAFLNSKNSSSGRKRKAWPEGRPNYLHFTMAKENKDNHFALNCLANHLRMNISCFGSAGTKDRRGVTVQRLSLYRPDAKRVHQLNKSLRGIRVYDFAYEAAELRLGDSSGNRFNIVLRDLKQEGMNNAELRKDLTERIEKWKESGFVNYFGTQRFGSCGTDTAEVGKLLIQKDYKKAIDMLLSDRDFDDGNLLQKALQVYNQTGNASQALNTMKGLSAAISIESKVFRSLAKNKLDFKAAILAIPRQTRSMYVHAYQSRMFNKVLSKRVVEHGSAALAGDLGSKGEVLPEGASPFEVYMPLASAEVNFAQNETTQWYKDILKEDGIDLQLFNDAKSNYAVGSSYRPAFVKPGNVEFKFVEGYDANAHLQPDLEHFPSVSPLTSPASPTEELALIIEFDLPPGIYATVALRELVRSDLGKLAQKSNSARTTESIET